MKKVRLGNTGLQVPSVVVGCMRFAEMTQAQMTNMIHHAMDMGANYFDHADIYGGGRSEEIFGRAMAADGSLKREDMILQSKCGIRPMGKYPHYDLSREYILSSVDGILKWLQTEYLDVLLLHRPDALVEPEEVAEAFDTLQSSGKVKMFGVSNHRPMQIELLKKYVKQDLIIDQLQFSIPASGMIAGGMEVNMTTEGAADRDGSVLDYCRLKDMTIQAWSPFQIPGWRGCFLGSPEYPELNAALAEIAAEHGISIDTAAAAWILRHPAGIQIIAGTTDPDRLTRIAAAGDVKLSREEWYRLYQAAGNPIP